MTTDNFCFYFQNRLIRTSQTGGQWYSDTSPISIPWVNTTLLLLALPLFVIVKKKLEDTSWIMIGQQVCLIVIDYRGHH
jgi:hypothetical protein